MSRSGRIDGRNAGDDCPKDETGKIDETAGEALANAGFEPSKKGRRIVGQGRPREILRKRAYQTNKTGEKSTDREVADEGSQGDIED
ncbi:hypothetical protein [Rhizobium laguerreae]|uniref:hypothetical protein n=1 Tax=Rhizobium laguerreae TaxID=1076926 RepID=UPI001C8FADA0|nr:hypothetical protein [Rhizobium laguerreae]MBY3206858.1 hypothetical protein [Rhizobium laguerreae]